MSKVTEIKINLSEGNDDQVVAAIAISWHTEDNEKLTASKFFFGNISSVTKNTEMLIERLLNELKQK